MPEPLVLPPRPHEEARVPHWVVMSREDGGQDMDPSTAMVYALITRWSTWREDGRLITSQIYIARVLGMSVRTVQRSLKWLIDNEFILPVGKRHMRRGNATTMYRYIPEVHNRCIHEYRTLWRERILEAAETGQEIRTASGRTVDVVTALMHLEEDIRGIVDSVATNFDELWQATVNQNTPAAANSEYRRLVRDGYVPEDIYEVWTMLQHDLMANGRPASKMPNFARWCSGEAGGIDDARTMLDDYIAERTRKEASAQASEMVDRDYDGSKRIYNEIKDMEADQAAGHNVDEARLASLRAEFAQIFLAYRTSLNERDKRQARLRDGPAFNLAGSAVRAPA